MDARGLFALPAWIGGLVAWMARRRAGSARAAEQAAAVIELGGLRLALLRRCAPDAADPWDRNALSAEAVCAAQGRELRARGPLMSAVDLEAWRGKLPAFLDGGDAELHLCSVSDCVGLHLQQPVRDDMAAVTVVLVDPLRDSQTLHEAWHAGRGLLFLVTRGQLEGFRAQLEQAMRLFPVHYGHTLRGTA